MEKLLNVASEHVRNLLNISVKSLAGGNGDYTSVVSTNRLLKKEEKTYLLKFSNVQTDINIFEKQ